LRGETGRIRLETLAEAFTHVLKMEVKEVVKEVVRREIDY
jgi:hypothetical protein